MKQRLIVFSIIVMAVLLLASCRQAISPVESPEGGENEVQSLAKKATVWTVPGDFATIQEAIDDADVEDGHIIRVAPGEHAGALVDKAVVIKGEGGTIINDGPPRSATFIYGFCLLAGSDGAVFSHLTFTTTDLSIYNNGLVDDVKVIHCTFLNAVQAVSNWGGCGWEISHNTIEDLRTRNGGGIGILVADRSGGIVQENVVSHNKIYGTLHVWQDDGGGYNGSGIALYADFRSGRLGAEAIRENRVVQNKVGMVSDTPEVVNIVAFELTDSRGDENLDPVIFNNAIGFNDFRGTELQIFLTPENLDDVNDISRNLGDNRGHGLHPSVFGPSGH